MDNAAYFATRDLVERNPAYRWLFVDALRLCAVPYGEGDLSPEADEGHQLPVVSVRIAGSGADADSISAVAADAANSAIDARRTSAAAVQTAASLFAMLGNAGALRQIIAVDGVLYDGDIGALQADNSIADDADIFFGYTATEAGRRAACDLMEESSLSALCANRPHHAEAFRLVLALCQKQGGCTAKDLEGPLDEAGYLRRDERTHLPTVYPSFFAGALETVGLLRWDESHWRITAKGSAALAAGAGE